MLTTLNVKSILIFNTCQEYWRTLLSFLSKSVDRFFINHNLARFRKQKSNNNQIVSTLSILSISNLLQIGKIGVPYSSVIQTKIMDQVVRVYLPSRDFSGEKINNEEMIQKMSELFARLFGGCTIFPAKGVWLSKNGQTIFEEITLMESYADGVGFEECLKAVLLTVLDFKVRYNQESMALTVNNRFFLL